MLPLSSSCATVNTMSLDPIYHANIVDLHVLTTSRTKEFGPIKVETNTPFRVKGIIVIV